MIDNPRDLSLLHQLFAEVRDLTKRLDRFENEIPSLRYNASRAEELEYLANPYSCDGEPLCDFNRWQMEDEQN